MQTNANKQIEMHINAYYLVQTQTTALNRILSHTNAKYRQPHTNAHNLHQIAYNPKEKHTNAYNEYERIQTQSNA